jgi:ferric-dicitrate binding protein FerR (iron transport regulator)
MNDQDLLQTMQHIGRLFFRKLNNELSEPDKAVLEAWLNEQEPASRQFFEQMTDWEQVQTALQSMYQVDEQAALADVQKKIQLNELTMAPIPVRRMSWLKYAAAAVVIGTIGAVITWTLVKKKTTGVANQPVGVRFKNDVLPGRNKATLQLADGKMIVLDSANKGTIAREGNTNIVVDEKAGSLQYHTGAVTKETNGTKSEVSYNTLSTPKGGQYRLVLPDGSKVWLNAASSIYYPTVFTGNERRVALTGEAYFEVAHNAGMPFIVDVTGGKDRMGSVEVLGTHFNINAYEDETATRVTLVQGKVKVGNETRKAGVPQGGSKDSVVLTPGKQAVLMAASRLTTADANVEEVTAWKDGLFYFQNARIETIMRQVSRWYDVKVQYEGKIEQEFIGKIPRAVNVSTLLKILESTGWVHFTIQGNVVTVTS